MIKVYILRRILYAGAGLVILVAVLLTLLVLPSVILNKSLNATPVFGILVVVILHLLVLYAFREAIIVNKRNGHLENIVFIVSGTGLLLLGLAVMDGAFAYLGTIHMYLASISMFICVGCDFCAAVIAFAALFLQPKKSDKK